MQEKSEEQGIFVLKSLRARMKFLLFLLCSLALVRGICVTTAAYHVAAKALFAG